MCIYIHSYILFAVVHPEIVSVSPSSIDEYEGVMAEVTCNAKHASFIIWSHSDESVQLDIVIDNVKV